MAGRDENQAAFAFPRPVSDALLTTVARRQTRTVSDDYIDDTIRQKLAADSVVKGGAIEVEVKDGVVTLKGKVRNRNKNRRLKRSQKSHRRKERRKRNYDRTS